MKIRLDDLRGPEVIQLLHTHLQSMAAQSPPESVHALDLDGLRKPEVTFWSVWQDSELMGCGALKELDSRHGEINDAHGVVPPAQRGRVARHSTHSRRGKASFLSAAQPGNGFDRGVRTGSTLLRRGR
jgi:putative acetyltransferase